MNIIDQSGIFLVFMIYAAICLVCLAMIAVITMRQQGQISRGEVLVIEEIKQDDDEDSGGEEAD